MFYNTQKIEKKWQKTWEKNGIYKIKDKIRGKNNFYHLVMFPYPSGNLHIGHWYNFAPADVFARFKRMRGFNVLSPIGFDAFGLPAENAAIKRGIHPKDWTYKNIKIMTDQLKSMGNMYDWSHQIITSDPEYYKWTQWMFLQMFKNGLVYRKKAAANWCPKCHTVLANEQVIQKSKPQTKNQNEQNSKTETVGVCERCETEVVQREIEQWLFKITDYAEKLLKDLNELDWPEKTKTMQKNWIGKSEGAIVKFNVKCQMLNVKCPDIEIFTTRLDTIFGCTYLVVAPEHKIISNLKSQISNFNEVKKYISETNKKTDLQRTELIKDKTGVELKGIKAINPFNNEEIPIFAADYVLGSYGTGAVMAVPAHDERDWEFAKKYNLPIKIVICPNPAQKQTLYGVNFSASICPILEKAYTGDGYLVNSGKFTGITSEKAREEMTKWLEQNKFGSKKINYKLRDWLISRQRYWGAPIPIIYCNKCGIIPVSEKDLPIKLPNVKNYLPTEEGQSPLAHSKKFFNVKCPKCGGQAKRETDTMDTFVCSSWYYLRYTDPKNSKKFADAKKIKNWLPVNMYIGGAEHATMHLLYVRFFTKVLYDLKYINFKEPFLSLRHQGIILGTDGQKMSKSRGNVVDPDGLVEQFGVDCIRMYFCFMGQYDQGGPWNPDGILGIKRFLDKIYKLISKKTLNSKIKNLKLERLLHQTIKKVTEDIENFQFNTAISALMILLNEMEHANNAPSPKDLGNANTPMQIKYIEIFLKLLAPFAPHLTEELWQQLRSQIKNSRFKSIHQEQWPQYDPRLIKEEEFELIIQINGKMRDKISANIGISQKETENLVFKREKVINFIKEKKPKKIIFVPNKLINIVI